MKHIIFALCVIALSFSCSSDEEIFIPELESNFYGLQVGNSWNYRIYKADQNYDLVYNGIDKDISVVGIENIDGNEFYKLKIITSGSTDNHIEFPNGEVIQYRRIEDGALLNENNKVIFVNNNFTERLISENDWGNIYSQNVEELVTITVDAGEFTCNEMLVYAKTPEGEQLASLDHYYYADGVGLVSSSVSFIASGQVYYKTILNSYDIQ